MECEQFRESIVCRVYDEPGEDPGLEQHLAQCPACREDLESFDELSMLYRESSGERMPERVRAGLFHPVRSREWAPVAAGLAAACLLGVLVLGLPTREDRPDCSWDVADFEAQGIVLPVSPEERQWLSAYREASPRWDRVVFSGGEIESIRRRLDELQENPVW